MRMSSYISKQNRSIFLYVTLPPKIPKLFLFLELQEFLADKLKIQDTCGVHNLHGMPAVLAAVAGAIMAAMAKQEDWGVR